MDENEKKLFDLQDRYFCPDCIKKAATIKVFREHRTETEVNKLIEEEKKNYCTLYNDEER